MHYVNVIDSEPAGIVAGVLLASTTWLVTSDQASMLPVPVPDESTIATPTTVLLPAVQAANVMSAEFVTTPPDAAFRSVASISFLA
jgi:hypothetical protein